MIVVHMLFLMWSLNGCIEPPGQVCSPTKDFVITEDCAYLLCKPAKEIRKMTPEKTLEDFKGNQELFELHTTMRNADIAWRIAQQKWMRSEDGWTQEDIRDLVSKYIQASYAFQKKRWGKIVAKMSIPSIMR